MKLSHKSAALAVAIFAAPAFSYAQTAPQGTLTQEQIQAQIVNAEFDTENVLENAERATLRNQLLKAENPAQVDALMAQIRERIEARKAFKETVKLETKTEAQAKIRADFEEKYMTAKTERERLELKEQVKEQVRVNLQDKNQVMAEGNAIKNKQMEKAEKKEERTTMFISVGGSHSGAGGGSDRGGSGGGSGGGSDRGNR